MPGCVTCDWQVYNFHSNLEAQSLQGKIIMSNNVIFHLFTSLIHVSSRKWAILVPAMIIIFLQFKSLICISFLYVFLFILRIIEMGLACVMGARCAIHLLPLLPHGRTYRSSISSTKIENYTTFWLTDFL